MIYLFHADLENFGQNFIRGTRFFGLILIGIE